jgi:hypothetical protein
MKHQGGEMVAHAILFIVLPLAVAWFAGVTAYLPPYSLPPQKTEPVEPEFEAEVRAFLAQHSEPDADAARRMVPGVRGNTPTIVSNLADRMRMEGNVAGALPLSQRALGKEHPDTLISVSILRGLGDGRAWP